ncbi:MAG: alanine--tRNA ligase [Candidatus Altiarchaeota archaeon]
MAWDFKELKRQKKPEFHRNFEKYYPVGSLEEIGFSRKVCKKCGRGFWSAVERDYCDEPSCSGGYRFIGEKLTKKKFSYKGAWDEYVKIFKKWDYVPIKRYPVVCRWYDELYFVNAGINDFQPYVVAGLVEPSADAVLEPQFCLRFPDIDSVGITGRHYTGFIMVGQHTFRTPEKPNVYFKDEGIKQMHEFLTKGLGIKPEEIFYHEDVWAGGGNFGPSMEFFSRGLELGNQVYMQYEVLQDGTSRELKTKVIDMGAGLERWSWFSQGVPMSYDTVFPDVMKHLYRETGVKPDNRMWSQFARYAGLLDIDELGNLDPVWNQVSTEMGITLDELKKEVYLRRALYAIADHTRTLLVAIHDGALPSNVGGGYNLRSILRRCWSLMDEHGWSIDLHKVLDKHVNEFGEWYTELREKGSLHEIIDVERERYDENRRKCKTLVSKMIGSGEKFTPEKLVGLYDSQGINPELIKEFNSDLRIPENFYGLVEERHEQVEGEKKQELQLKGNYDETKQLYYEREGPEFNATVLGVEGDYLILDRTLFYPEGGGQEADYGIIGSAKVLDVQKAGNVIAHKVDSAGKFREGMLVSGKVDWDRRTQLSQHHTATHIVNVSARKVLGPHVWQAGAHKSVDISRLDITHYRGVSDDELKKIETEANLLVGKAIPIRVSIMKRNEAEEKHGFRLYQGGAVPGTELRIVEIKGVDAEACGGTHLNNTKEAGRITLVRSKRIQDGIVRLEFKAGAASDKHSGTEEELFQKSLENLPADVRNREFNREALTKAAAVFSVQKEKLPETLERFVRECKEFGEITLGSSSDLASASEILFSEWKRLRKEKEKQGGLDAGKVVEDIERKFKESSRVAYIVHDANIKELRKIAEELVKKEGRLLVLFNVTGEKANFIVASSSEDASAVAKKISEKIGGGYSGNNRMCIGGGSAEKLEPIVKSLF